MKLIYTTGSLDRAHEIMSVLSGVGVEVSIQGQHTYSIVYDFFNDPLSIWVHDNNDYDKACGVLEDFFNNESRAFQHHVDNGKRFSPYAIFLISVFLGAIIGMIVQGA